MPGASDKVAIRPSCNTIVLNKQRWGITMDKNPDKEPGFLSRITAKSVHFFYGLVAFSGAVVGTQIPRTPPETVVIMQPVQAPTNAGGRREDLDPYPEILSRSVSRNQVDQRQSCERVISARFLPERVTLSIDHESSGSHGRIILYRVIRENGAIDIVPCLVDDPRQTVTSVYFTTPAPPR